MVNNMIGYRKKAKSCVYKLWKMFLYVNPHGLNISSSKEDSQTCLEKCVHKGQDQKSKLDANNLLLKQA